MRKRRLFQTLAQTAIVLVLAGPVSADIIFDTIPASGNVSGPPGTVVGWGYGLSNTDTSNWFMATNLNSDSFSNGTPTLLFDFPIMAPSTSVTEPFDPAQSIGLFELQWDVSAPVGFVDSGSFVLSGQWWDGDPLNGGTFIANAPDIALPYSAKVGTTPEPSSFVLMAGAACLLLVFWCVRNRGLCRCR